MKFVNATHLDSRALRQAFEHHSSPYRHDELSVRVGYTRSTPFRGACFYRDARIRVNIGRRNRYPFALATYVAKARKRGRGWSREPLYLELADAGELALFIYLHELYHFLVQRAGRGIRRKEAMCDRFATRVLVDEYRCVLRDGMGQVAPRAMWDFQDLEAFVAGAPRCAVSRSGSVTIAGRS
jgi:hypothetical protein